MRTSPETILAIDPGLREIGYAVLRGDRLLGHGVKSLRSIPPGQRLSEARKSLATWLEAYRPRTVVLEATHAHPTGTFQEVHLLARSLATSARQGRRRIVTVSAQSVRRRLVGNGKAPKVALARAMADVFPALRVYLTQDRRWKEAYWRNMFDAVGLALYHWQSR